MNLQDMLEGKPVTVEIGNKEYQLRQPTSAERDEAELIEAKAGRYLRMTDKEIKELAELPAPQEEIEYYNALIEMEIERIKASDETNTDVELIDRNARAMKANLKLRTAATTIITQYATNKRNKFLAKTLLIDEDFDNLLPFEQDALAQAAAGIMNDISSIPFLLETQPEQQ